MKVIDMVSPDAKFPENIKGAYYVDENCIACGVCVAKAPDNFQFIDDEDHAYTYKQPADDKAREECVEAMESCPIDAIGNDD